MAPDVKEQLIKALTKLRDLEERARLLYKGMIESNLMNRETLGIITRIMNDEVMHVKLAEEMIKIVRDYDFKMEIMRF